ncbi:unnamed protein product [Paramecium pentaurelia]|uniref:Transmembrane protein n=1 Tax=Paramecium pentaurelia TaxID=43138 RepID=A0A8S1UYU5_9CILI|nr:unnamed protein product [Paramecium pentaurelia]
MIFRIKNLHNLKIYKYKTKNYYLKILSLIIFLVIVKIKKEKNIFKVNIFRIKRWIKQFSLLELQQRKGQFTCDIQIFKWKYSCQLSPCVWQHHPRNYVQDDQLSSFLFSQTHNQIYPLKKMKIICNSVQFQFWNQVWISS